jgi:hypothetical protein
VRGPQKLERMFKEEEEEEGNSDDNDSGQRQWDEKRWHDSLKRLKARDGCPKPASTDGSKVPFPVSSEPSSRPYFSTHPISPPRPSSGSLCFHNLLEGAAEVWAQPLC